MQNVNWTKQAMLAGALLALGTTAYWLEYKHKPDSESKEEQGKKIFSIKDKAIASFTIRDGSGRVYTARCTDTTDKLCKPGDNSKWELTAPLKLKADDGNANALLSALNNLASGESISLKEETPEKRAALLKEYGLDQTARLLPATRRVEVSTPTETMTLYLGLNHPIGDSLFGILERTLAGQPVTGKAAANGVGVDEERVVLVPTFFKTNFDHDLTYWRDKKLLTIGTHEIASFDLKAPRVQVRGVRKDGQWTLNTAKAADVPGDIENIDNLLTAAAFITAKNFASDSKSDAKGRALLAKAKTAILFTFQPNPSEKDPKPAPITLTLFQKGDTQPRLKKGGAGVTFDGKLYATVSNLDPVYELEPNAFERFDKQLRDLRLTKLITSMERFTTKKIEFGGKPLGASALVLSDKDGKWSIEGSTAPVAADKIQGVLEKLSGNRIQEFLDTAPAGQEDGLTVKLTDDKNVLRRQLAFWKSGAAGSEKLYARDLGAPRKEVYVVDYAVKDALPWARDFFEPKAPPVAPVGASVGGPGAPMPPPATGTAPPAGMPAVDGHAHAPLPGAPPEPGKNLIPQPATTSK